MKNFGLIHLHKIICVCICLFACVIGLRGQEKADTIRVHALREVDVTGEKRPSATRSTSPLQTLKRAEMEKLGALQVSDAAKFFSGVQVKDYGGVGGLKTISVRGLGANHTAVSYDGVAITDYQTGQMDLGRISLDNVEMISLHAGAGDDIFQTARMQSSASAFHISSRPPDVTQDKKTSIVSAWRSGSFGLANPSLSCARMLSDAVSVSISGEYLHTEGDYPYTSGSGERKKREHSEVENFRLETGLFGNFGNGKTLRFKMYGYQTGRSLPGPDIYFANSPGERLKDRQFFSQAVYRQTVFGKLLWQSVAKFDISGVHYTSFSLGERKTAYRQWEYYAGTTLLLPVAPSLSVSWANDGSYAGFRNDFARTSPVRTGWQSALSAKYDCSVLTATASVQSFYSRDEVRVRDFSEETFDLSPSLGLSVRMLKNIPLRLRGFYRESFRQPTFADMYAAFVPAQGLKPEKAKQLNAGLTWTDAFGASVPYVSVTIDAYRNRVENRIIAYPTSSMYFWSVQNLGKMEIRGIDVAADVHVAAGRRFTFRAGGAYTFQNVLDRTDPSSRMYNQQIQYTPRHSGSVHADVSTPCLDISYTALYCGERYYERINRPEYLMKAYWDQGLSLSKQIRRKEVAWTLTASCLNIFDQSYEVVRSYPMPGRSFRFSLQLKY